MNAAAVFILAATAPATPAPLPYVDDAYSDIERALDGAGEELNSAATYTCQEDGAGAAMAPLGAKLERLKDEAEAILGRQLNLTIRTASCRRAGDSPEFRTLLSRADHDLRRAERLIKRERAH